MPLKTPSGQLTRKRTSLFAASTLAATTAMIVALTLSACSTAPTNTHSDLQSDDGQLQVVTTTTQLADFAREIGGDDATVRGLLAAGGSAHHFDPAPKDLLALSQADVLVVNGAGLEGFVDSAIDASGFSGTIITAANGVDLEAAHEITAAAEHEAESDDHDGHDGHDGHDDHDSHEGHDGHDHGDLNPHLWTSPRFAAGMVAEIARGFAAVDPVHAEGYAQRASAYESRLAALDTWIAPQFAAVAASERVLVTGHDSLRYFLHDYDIAFAGAIMPGFEDNAEPSVAAIDALIAEIKARGVRAIFVESSMSPKLAQTIAREAGVIVVDADSLYADALGAPGTTTDTYIDATVHNTRLILESWGEPVAPVPAEIGSRV